MSDARRLKFEVILFVALASAGLVILPFCIYFVGGSIIGEYATDAGPMDLLRAIWTDVWRLNPAALLLVASPWLVISCLRIALRLMRRRPRVTASESSA